MKKKLTIMLLLILFAVTPAMAASNQESQPTKLQYRQFIDLLSRSCSQQYTNHELKKYIKNFTQKRGISIDDPFICKPIKDLIPDGQPNRAGQSFYDIPADYDLDCILFYTPLMYAIANNNLPLVEALLARGANPEATNKRTTPVGWTTPMHQAASKGLLEIMQILHERGASLNATDYYGHTPLQRVMGMPYFNNQTKTQRWLITHGASYTLQTPTGENIFHIAARNNLGKYAVPSAASNPTAIATALRQQLPPRRQGPALPGETPEVYGNTPLHIAAEQFNTNAVECLLTLGAKNTIRNSAGRTPLQSALARTHIDRCYASKCRKQHEADGRHTHSDTMLLAIKTITLFLDAGIVLTPADLDHVAAGMPEADRELARREISTVFAKKLADGQEVAAVLEGIIKKALA